jgi:hypothetical protein
LFRLQITKLILFNFNLQLIKNLFNMLSLSSLFNFLFVFYNNFKLLISILKSI